MNNYSPTQNFLLQGLLVIVVIGALLPVGIFIEYLALADQPTKLAVEHGELFLAAGSAVLLGCIALLTSRFDPRVVIASLFAVATFVVPCYVAWAEICGRAAMHEKVAQPSSYAWGVPVLVLGAVVALTFVWCGRDPFRTEEDTV
jgi:hypothetical protein